jgi:aldose 1-epimerase
VHDRVVSRIEGVPTVTIASDGEELTATFAPGAGMVCCSLRHRGEELLGQRRGLRAYAERGSTMGIPLLHPWANRLASWSYDACGQRVAIPDDSPLVSRDGAGLPIHGVIGSHLPWELVEEPGKGGDRLRARMRFQEASLLAVFPFAHELALEARLQGSTLRIETTLRPTSEIAVPVSFGYHPYLTLPGARRAGWQVELPVTSRLVLDERMIPTGVSEHIQRPPFELAETSWDDAFDGLKAPPLFAVSGGGRRIELEFLEGYPFAQVFAPAGEELICFEPMTAPANALISGDCLRAVQPGKEFRAAFRISAL